MADEEIEQARRSLERSTSRNCQFAALLQQKVGTDLQSVLDRCIIHYLPRQKIARIVAQTPDACNALIESVLELTLAGMAIAPIASFWFHLYTIASNPYKFSVQSLLHGDQINRQRVRKMSHPETANYLFIPETNKFQDLILWLMQQPEPFALTDSQTQQRLAVNQAYADATNRPLSDWFRDTENAGRWGRGELDRVVTLLDESTTSLLLKLPYRACRWETPTIEQTFWADLQQLEVEGKKLRLGRYTVPPQLDLSRLSA